MDLRAALTSGEAGARLELPAGPVEALGAAGLRIVDEAAGLVVQVRLLGWRLDLSSEHEALLRSDLERDARWRFERAFVELAQDPTLELPMRPDAPRTADPAWSALVEAEPVPLAGGRALRAVHREAYQPTLEIAHGRLLVPIATGLLELVHTAVSRQTGGKEAVLMDERMRTLLRPGMDPREVMPGQRVIDDPALDARFPEAPLARIRAAQQALLDPAARRLVVTRATATPELDAIERHDVVVPEARCVLTPPPRCLRVPAGVPPGSQPPGSQVHFTRVGLGSAAPPRLFSVQRVTDADAARDAGALAAFARRRADAWAQEGVTGISARTTPRAPWKASAAAVTCLIDFVTRGGPCRAAQAWVVDPSDGSILRLEASGGAHTPFDDFLGDADDALRSLRTLEWPPPPTPGPRPWWRLWG